MVEKEIIINGLKVNYKVFGQGDPLLILHGWRSNSDRWQNVADILAQKYMVIIPDLPGFGKSQEPRIAWKIDQYVGWLSEFSEAFPELSKGFNLIGHSFGGALAVKFTLRHTQKVKKLFLVAASCIRVVTLSKKLMYNVSKIVKVFYFFPFYELFRKFVYKYIIRRSDYPYVSGIMRDIYLNVISDDLYHKLPFLKTPTVIIWGDKDEFTPLEHAHIINKQIHHSKLILINGAGHNMHNHNFEALAQAISENI